ncbi:MAG: hypothetical protein QG635_1028, partial [Bacteroidota bacterium]|nr:hypothetical protein [Bacteroidota bacterium]
GAAALVRAKFPDLSSRQALEVTRLGSDNIEALNPEKKGLIPCRLNMYKAVSRDPFDYPSIRPIKVNYLLHDSLPKNRFFTGDTLRLNIICRNYLGKARNVGFKLSTVGDSTKSISIIADSVWLDSIDRESLFTLDKFIIAIKRPNYKNPFLRVDITADSAYKDFFLIEFIPTATYTDFSNDSISITLADNGRIGYADPLYNTKGIGFGLNSYCSLIAEGGLMVSEYGLKLVSNVRDTNSTTSNDFTNIKPFQPPDENIGIFSDEYSANRIGLEITEKINLVGKSSRFTRIEYDIKNVSNNALDQVSAGLFLDWEIGFEGDSNMIVEFPEGFPPDIAGLPHVSALISRQGNYPFAGAAVWTYENWSNPVLSGFPNKITYSDTGFTFSKKYKSLNSGIDINIDKPTDIASVIGMKFMGPMIIGDSRQMYVCLCAGYTPSEIWKSLWNCIDSTINSVSDNQLSTEAVTISPQPASDKLIINTEVSKINNIEIYNLTGILMKNIIFSDNFNEEVRDSGDRHILDIYDLPSGFYTMKISADEKFYFIKFIVIK